MNNFEYYLVCEKSDGVRYILIIYNTGEAYLVGRKEKI
jgi:hypothetical protein